MCYSDLLKDERWKTLSARIKKRDNFKCVLCDCTTNLNVHHKRYVGMPWESPSTDLITLCSKCHKTVHKLYEPEPFHKTVKNKKENSLPIDKLSDFVKYLTVRHYKIGCLTDVNLYRRLERGKEVINIYKSGTVVSSFGAKNSLKNVLDFKKRL